VPKKGNTPPQKKPKNIKKTCLYVRFFHLKSTDSAPKRPERTTWRKFIKGHWESLAATDCPVQKLICGQRFLNLTDYFGDIAH
jgi:hypothetical protein